MGGVPVKHHSHGKVGRRRSHLALKKIVIRACSQCRGPVIPHRACAQCGLYPVRPSSLKEKSVTLTNKKNQSERSVGKQDLPKEMEK